MGLPCPESATEIACPPSPPATATPCNFLIWGGVVYLALGVYGLFAVGAPEANVIPVNGADNWLHLGLAVGMIALGIFVGRDRSARTTGTPAARDA